jgi:aspartyl-tRNA synthetase
VTERTQEHVTLVEANLHTWLLNSKIASHAYPNLSSEDQAIVNRTLELNVGDDVWLAYRPRILKVCSAYFGEISYLT